MKQNDSTLVIPNRWMATGRIGVVLLLTPLLLISIAVASIAGDSGVALGIFLGVVLVLTWSTTYAVVWSVRICNQMIVRRTFHSSCYELSEIDSVSAKNIPTQFALIFGVKTYTCIEFLTKDGFRFAVLSPSAERVGQLKELIAKHQIPAYW